MTSHAATASFATKSSCYNTDQMRLNMAPKSQWNALSILMVLALLFGIVISISMNIFLLTGYLHAPDTLLHSTVLHKPYKSINCNKQTKQPPPQQQSALVQHPDDDNNKHEDHIEPANAEQLQHVQRTATSTEDRCHFNTSLQHKIYLYDLPWSMRELPRMRWYEMFNKQSHANYNDTVNFNFGFGDLIENYREKDFYSTHMHSLEIILNERFKKADYYLTTNPDEALLFHIPFPFAQHFRFYHRGNADHISGPHDELYSLIESTSTYQKYFKQKPHFLLYGRIAYETGRMGRMGSKFWRIHDGDVETYWHVSIDRNCHGDPPSCLKRISMPHPSNFHPTNVQSLKHQIDKIKRSWENKRNVYLAFCGAVRTPLRKNAQALCRTIRWNKWGVQSGYKELCRFEDSTVMEENLKKKGITNYSSRLRSVETEYGKKCLELYDESVFCLQDGADSTTRKALWDGMIGGCIPVFLSGVMSAEFECFGGNNNPWYLVLQPEYYIKQLMSLSQEYVDLLRRNLLRMIPKILYTNGEAGFADAFDVLLHCLVRKTAFENQMDNPGCTMDDVIAQKSKLYDFDDALGYTELYRYLEI